MKRGKTDVFDAFTFAVAKEGAVASRVDFVEDGDEKVGGELKVVGELVHDLPRTVHELQEDRRCLTIVPRKQKAISIRKLITTQHGQFSV